MKIAVILFIAVFLQTEAIGSVPCTTVLGAPARFDTLQYMFQGRVLGYTEPIVVDATKRESFGLLVHITRVFYSPEPVTDTVEVYPFEVGSSCEASGRDLLEVTNMYPVGSHVRVVGRPLSDLDSVFSDLEVTSRKRLCSFWFLSLGFTIRHYPDNPWFSRNEAFDYAEHSQYVIALGDSTAKAWEKLPSKKDIPFDWEASMFSIANKYLRYWEIRRDQLRLSKALTTDEKKGCLKRLLLAGFGRDRFQILAESVLTEKEDIDEMMSLYDAR